MKINTRINKILLLLIIIIILSLLGVALIAFNNKNDINIQMITKQIEQLNTGKYTSADIIRYLLKDVEEVRNTDIIEKNNIVTEINITVNRNINKKYISQIFEIVNSTCNTLELLENNNIIKLSIIDNYNDIKLFEIKKEY